MPVVCLLCDILKNSKLPVWNDFQFCLISRQADRVKILSHSFQHMRIHGEEEIPPSEIPRWVQREMQRHCSAIAGTQNAMRGDITSSQAHSMTVFISSDSPILCPMYCISVYVHVWQTYVFAAPLRALDPVRTKNPKNPSMWFPQTQKTRTQNYLHLYGWAAPSGLGFNPLKSIWKSLVSSKLNICFYNSLTHCLCPCTVYQWDIQVPKQ